MSGELPPAAEAEVRRAVEAVAGRDASAVAALLESEDASTFWIWADDYGDQGRLDLATPPGPIVEWPLDVMRTDVSGLLYVTVPKWDSLGSMTDLTLELHVHDADSEQPRVELLDFHVM